MKNPMKTLLLLLTLATTPLMAQRYTVVSNVDYSAPFDDYKTYSWAKQVTMTNSLAYAINDLTLKSKIKDAVAHEMEARTMTMQKNNPDILVNFRVFEKPVTIEEADGFFTDADYWGTDEVRNNALGTLPYAATYNEDDTEYFLDKGTLMVQLVDAKKGVVVWQGYASGLMDGNVFDRNPDHVAKAARLIFDKLDLVMNQ